LAACPGGYFIEFGVGGGGYLRQFAARTDRTIYGFDWFFGLPEDWGMAKIGTFTEWGEVPKVPGNCTIIAGLIQATLPAFLLRHRNSIAFVHFDLDLYSATSFALMVCKDRFAHGAILLFDEMVGMQRNLDNEGKAFCEFLKATNYTAEYLGQLGHGESAVFRLLVV
jgi:hypothetical protein